MRWYLLLGLASVKQLFLHDLSDGSSCPHESHTCWYSHISAYVAIRGLASQCSRDVSHSTNCTHYYSSISAYVAMRGLASQCSLDSSRTTNFTHYYSRSSMQMPAFVQQCSNSSSHWISNSSTCIIVFRVAALFRRQVLHDRTRITVLASLCFVYHCSDVRFCMTVLKWQYSSVLG